MREQNEEADIILMKKSRKRADSNNFKHECNVEDCNRRFKSRSHLTRHMLVHNNERVFKCLKCEKKFACKDNMKAHYLNIHENVDEKLKCSYDGCSFATFFKNQLTIHIKIHHAIKRSKCTHDGCEKSFSTSCNLVCHVETHSCIKRYKCAQVGCEERRFRTKYNLSDHVLSHHKEKRFLCDKNGCDYKTNDERLIKNHIAYHAPGRIFKNGVWRSDVAGQEVKFKCAFKGCSFVSIHKRKFNIHSVVHTNHRRFKCNHKNCSKTFKRKSHLNHHSLTHLSSKKIKCAFNGCEKVFKRKEYLKEHVKKAH